MWYPGDVILNYGTHLTPTKVKNVPKVEWNASCGYYTLVMFDLDAPTRKHPVQAQFRHWLVMNIKGNDVRSGDEIIEYIGAGPPKGSGLHRYVFLVLKQSRFLRHDEKYACNR